MDGYDVEFWTLLVQMDLLFARELSFYIITIYLPTMMIVIVSWFSFWIDHKSVSLVITLSPDVVFLPCLPGPGPREPVCDHPARHVHLHGLHPVLAPARGLHQGHTCYYFVFYKLTAG